ncbi:MAG TPA: hypothetical protein VF042_17205 [Gemmatimonadaceae bacterium]
MAELPENSGGNMGVIVRSIRRSSATALGLCAAFILASCGEEVIAPSAENYSPGVPLAALSSEFDQYQFLGFVPDDQGANDTPAQSDLNAFTRADNVSGKIAVKWVWDDVNSWTGSGQTGDACALFDTTPSNANKGKGMADFAVCVRITNPNGDASVVTQLAAPASPLLYSCGDSKSERCASPVKSLPAGSIKCEVEKVSGEGFFAAGDDSADVIAACSIPLSAISTTSSPNLLNVCSFPSGSPNSNPFDCVVTPGAGFFMIKKITSPQNSGETFSFTISPAPAGGASHSLTDNTTGVEQTSLISAVAGTKSYRVAESSIPSTWTLDAASCAFDRTGSPATGTKTGSAVDSVSIESGETTVCTFTNSQVPGTIEVKKIWSGTGGQTTLKIGTTAGGGEIASQLTGSAGATPLTTGVKNAAVGTYYVSESGGLDDYSSQLACTNKGTSFTPGASNSITVASGDVVVCTFTNTRNQGSIELTKVWSGTPGQTTLKIGTSAGGSQISSVLTGAAGASPLTTGAQTVNTGTYYVTEAGGLDNYSQQLACTSNGDPITPGASNSVTVARNAVVVCTFTNTRAQGSIELKKTWSGPGGQTTLKIGTTTGGSEIASQQTGAAGAAPLSTGAQGVNTGTYYVSESGGLAAYTSSLACTSNANSITPGAGNSVSVGSGATVVCTFTNTAVTPTITVVKTAGSSTVPETGGSVTYSVVVRNTSPIPVTLTSLNDDKFGDLAGKGTCDGTGNKFGSIAVSGTYSCSFSGTLAASNAGQAHVNEVTASASSDVGTATATDTARVVYSDVLPDISVVKSADFVSIAAVGGDSVSGFNADVRFARGGGGGSGGAVFANDVCDDKGANDINSAQSDLNCFSRADNLAGRIGLRWTWDAVAQWTGSGQTGDACALLDTDNNGSANFAFCVRITNPNGDPGVIAQVTPGSPVLYKCKDSSAERCASPNSIQAITNSTCSVEKVGNRMAGGEDDGDIEATCDVRLTDLGNNVVIANVDLLNVCSFPSGSPGSNAFDCVISPAAGLLVIADSTTSVSNAYFAFTLRNADNTASAAATNGDDKWEVQARGTSAGLPLLPGDYSLVQQVPTNWTLGSIICKRDGQTVGGASNIGQLTKLAIPIVSGSTTTCTFVNSLTASQTVTFTVVVTNNSLEAATLDSLADTENPDDATPTYATLHNVGTCATGGSIAGNGGTYTCSFTRTVSGTPGTTHKDKVRATGKDNENNKDTKFSNKITVTIN